MFFYKSPPPYLGPTKLLSSVLQTLLSLEGGHVICDSHLGLSNPSSFNLLHVNQLSVSVLIVICHKKNILS